MSTKSQQRVRAAFEAMGLPALLAKWEQAHEEGIASLDKFAGTLPAASPSLRNHGRAEAGRGTAAFFDHRLGPRKNSTPQAGLSRAYPVGASLPKPPLAMEWNDHVPGMQVKDWDSALEYLLEQCLANPVFTEVWPEVLQKCSAFDEAGQGRSLAAVLRGDWRKIANRELDWLIKPKNGNGGSNPNKAKIDAMLKGMLNA